MWSFFLGGNVEEKFRFKKKYGQNFINDENILKKIVNSADIKKDTLVLEIGCGAGALTKQIKEKTDKYIGYEIDITLKDTLSTIDENIIFDDFLKRNIKEDLKKYEYQYLYIISNLPYYITTPIITKIIKDKIDVDKMVIMVQKEVGDRFMAKPRSKEYNSLTIYLNYYFNIYKLFNVSRNVFTPKPNVDSAVICLEKKEKPNNLKNEDIFFKLIKDSFVQKRKTLKNNLKDYDFNKILEILKKSGYNDNVRAEYLPIEIFIDISNNII